MSLGDRLRRLLAERRQGQGAVREQDTVEDSARPLASRWTGVVKIDPREPWAVQARQDLQAMDEPSRVAWGAVLAHAETANSPRPSKRWLRVALETIDGVGRETFANHLGRWLTLVGESGRKRSLPVRRWEIDPRQLITKRNAQILRGLAWCSSLLDDDVLARALGSAAEACYVKIRNHGPRSPKVGNACVIALSLMPGDEPIAQLGRLKVRVKPPSAREWIEHALADAAQRAGVDRDDLEEMAVPTYGMQEVGRLEKVLGDVKAEIVIGGTTSAALCWIKPDGRRQTTVPAAVKRDHPQELKALRREVKDLNKMLTAQRDRIERAPLDRRCWEVARWRSHYLDHRLVGTVARRLIWRFQHGADERLGVWCEGRWVDAGGDTLEIGDDHAQVSLWHPFGASEDSVVAWRGRLEENGITQPFKQAHREVYRLTEAERQTGNYSNRFAAHILRQHQFAQLCRQRGWRYALQGNWDSHNVPTLELPRWNLRAEFWVEGMEDGGMGDNTSDTGVYLTVITDQVRFIDARCSEPVPLGEVPALVFSEAMRDVDLFVSVCSIGNDPTWADQGEYGGYATYWQEYSFGELSAAAKTRKEVLERLVPRLKIADRCSLSGRFLVVKGDVRTYKIHVGSGNILMEPHDEYLCIVRDRRGAAGPGGVPGKLFLPFEGDEALAVILSKAFLLADDRKIKDPTILAQIRSS